MELYGEMAIPHSIKHPDLFSNIKFGILPSFPKVQYMGQSFSPIGLVRSQHHELARVCWWLCGWSDASSVSYWLLPQHLFYEQWISRETYQPVQGFLTDYLQHWKVIFTILWQWTHPFDDLNIFSMHLFWFLFQLLIRVGNRMMAWIKSMIWWKHIHLMTRMRVCIHWYIPLKLQPVSKMNITQKWH